MTGLQHNGRDLRVDGYAALFGEEIYIDGQTEAFAPGAFSATLRRGAPYVRATINHRRADTWASVRDGSLRLWEDSTGLAFSAALPATPDGRGLARAVADGQIAASVLFRPSQSKPTPGGAIVTAATLTDVCLCTRPAYETAAWLSDFGSMRHMTDYAQDLRRRWRLGSMKNRTTRAPSSCPAPSRLRARAVTKRPAPIPMAVYNPAPNGLSQEEWEEFGFQESAGRRAHQEAQARKRARQRNRRAA